MKKLVALVLAAVLCFGSAQAITVQEASQFCGVDLTTCTLEELTIVQEKLREIANRITSVNGVVSDLIDNYGAVDYTAMTLEDAATAILAAAENTSCKLKTVELNDPEVIMIEVDLSSYATSGALIAAIQYSCEVFSNFFTRDDVPMVYLRFWEAARTSTGKATEMCTITMRVKADTAAQIDFAYFSEYAYSVQSRYFEALDGYSLPKDYKKIIK